MRLIESKVELLQQGKGLDGLYRQIELCGRTCYKSTDKITDNSAKPFVGRMIASNHLAMLEHGTVYLYLEINPENGFRSFNYPLANFITDYNWSDVVGNIKARYHDNKYSRIVSRVETSTEDNFYRVVRKVYITTNYRVIVENGWQDDLQFMCEPTEYHVKRYAFKVTTSIGVSREFNRSRSLSVAEQSTRYCNFTKDKFNNEVRFIRPSWMKLNTGIYEHINNKKDLGDVVGDGYLKNVSDRDEDNIFILSCLFAEDTYQNLINNYGWKPQQAREILPLCTATEVCYTGFSNDLKQFFDLRLFGKTGKPHPNAEYTAQLMREAAENAGIWEDIINQLSKF